MKVTILEPENVTYSAKPAVVKSESANRGPKKSPSQREIRAAKLGQTWGENSAYELNHHAEILPDTQVLKIDLKNASYHEAGHAVVAWGYGLRCRIWIQHSGRDPENWKTVEACCQPFQHEPSEHVPASISNRRRAVLCIAGKVAELMVSEGGEISPNEVIEYLDVDSLSDSDKTGIEAEFPQMLDDPGFVDLIKETTTSLYTNWDLVESLAEHLISLFNKEGVAVLTDGMFAELMSELQAERTEANRPEFEGSDLEA